MKYSFIIVFFVYSFVFSMSSREILDKVDEKYKKMSNFTANYKQVDYLELADKTTESKGKIFLRKGGIFRVENGKDFILSDNKTIWRYSSTNNQVLIENVKEDEDSFLPAKLLFDFSSKYEVVDYFEKKIKGKKVYVLSLVSPKGEERFINELKVYVNKDFIPYNIISKDIDENKRTFVLSDIKVDSDIPKDKFVFKTIKGVEIVDLRK